jgi:hypothetical protein
MKISASLLAVAWFCIGATAVASDLYVNNKTGSDTNSGVADVQRGPGVGPMRSITRALKAAKAGDTIVVANTDEPYRESLTLQGAKHSTNGVQPFRIQGNNAIIDGTVIVDDEAWEHAVKNVFSFKPHLLTYQQLYHRGKPLSRVQVDAIDQLADLEPLQWAMLDGRIYFCAEEDRLPQYYDLSYCGHPVGVTLYNVQGVVLEDLIIQGFQLDGLNAHDNVFDAAVFISAVPAGSKSKPAWWGTTAKPRLIAATTVESRSNNATLLKMLRSPRSRLRRRLEFRWTVKPTKRQNRRSKNPQQAFVPDRSPSLLRRPLPSPRRPLGPHEPAAGAIFIRCPLLSKRKSVSLRSSQAVESIPHDRFNFA